MIKKQLIAGNWKMNGLTSQASNFIEAFNSQVKVAEDKVDVVVCPPYTLLSYFKQNLASFVNIGAQDCYPHPCGAHTGNINAEMLKDMGCKYVIVGHSERRQKQYETNYMVSRKAEAVIEQGMTPIICIGETKEEKDNGKTLEVLNKQVKFSLPKSFDSHQVVIAYEPVWSIGTGDVPENQNIIDAIASIRAALLEISTEEVAKSIMILYGGSVNAANAADILPLPGVDGALVGGASLKVEDFMTIINAGGNCCEQPPIGQDTSVTNSQSTSEE